MAEFKKNKRFSGPDRRPFNKAGSYNKPSFGGSRDSGPRNFSSQSSPRELFDADCNKCGKRCQVPFRPNGKKPVYCADCFSQNTDRDDRGNSSSTYAPRKEYGASKFGTSHQSAPHTGNVPDRQIQELTKRMDVMNATLEKLVAALDMSNRTTALNQEVRKYVKTATRAPAPAPVKNSGAKTAPAKKPVKSAKKVAKSAKKSA